MKRPLTAPSRQHSEITEFSRAGRQPGRDTNTGIFIIMDFQIGDRNLIDAFRSGAFQAVGILGIHADHELIDDLMQEAYLGWHRHGHKAADDPISAWTYACRVARSAALHYLRSEREQRQMAGLLVERQRLGRCATQLPDEIAEALLAEFYGQRKKKGRRGAEAAIQEVVILSLLYAGYSNDGIAVETGLSPVSIKTYRQRIRRRLRKIKEKKDAA